MTKTPAIRGLLAGFLLLSCSVTQIHAQAKRTPPTPAQMLDARLAPKHDDVVISMPAPDEIAGCTVASVQGSTQGSSGWVLYDSKKQPLRRFYDSNGDDKVDVWSYYKDGVEVYRESDTTFKGGPNNFRWLNAGGMKWGVGAVGFNGKAVISSWRMISAEEAGFEAYQAVANNDFPRMQALLISEADMKLLKLPATKITAVAATQQKANAKFAQLAKSANLTKAKFEIVEGATPQCDNSVEPECIKFASRAIRYEHGDKKQHDWIHTGELIQVGMTWRLVDVPSEREAGTTTPNVIDGGPGGTLTDLQKALIELTKVDEFQPSLGSPGEKSPKVDTYLRKRIPMVQKIIPLDDPTKREGWYKQLFDNHMALAQNGGDDATFKALKSMADEVAAKMPKSALAGYGHYRVIWTRYAVDMAKQPPPTIKQITEIQDKWLENLSDFVKLYPTVEDTPEALRHLGNGSEFSGKDEEAKRWYTQLYESFPKHALADHAKGCVARLSLQGREMKLTAPLLNEPSKLFDISSLKGKVVIVHYWASYGDQYIDDFAKIKRLLDTKKNVELVSVNLDADALKAKEAVARAKAPGIHLFQAPPNNSSGVSSSPLATQYGIHILPTVFMIDDKGKVANRALQVSDIETELRRIQ